MSREMKNSGIPWIIQIPKEWSIKRGKEVLCLMKRAVRVNDEVVTCFRDGEVVLRSERRTEGFTMSDKEIGYQGINKGDIVIHGMDGFAGAMGVSKSTGKGSPVLIVCTPKYDAVPQFIIYYLRVLAMTDVFVALSTGIRERSCDLRWNKISELAFVLPTSIEQQAIADYLDKKCSEIDEMVSLQEKIIEELKAYKQSVITEAVTKGLNPDVQMKDSGIEWIGQIPKDWGIIRLRFVFSIIGGNGFKDEYQGMSDGDYPFYKTSDINGTQPFIENAVNYVNEDIATVEKYNIIPVNAIIVSKIGAALYKNHRKITTCQCCIDNNLEALVPSRRDSIKYLYYVLKIVDFAWFDNQGTVPSVNNSKLKDLYIPDISIQEQLAIAEFLDKKCAEIDTLISLKQSKIEALKEYKKSIIYEYVTGKKEVEA